MGLDLEERLNGRVAIVTGGSRGIGRAISERLAQEGARVAVNYTAQADAAAEVVRAIEQAGGSAIAIRADVSNQAEVRAMVSQVLTTWGTLDIMVNNAGISPMASFLEITEALFDRVVAVNLKGTFLCSQEAARVMLEQDRPGRIIAISSISAIVGGSLQSHYTPTKAGQRSMMRSLAIVLGPHGITCNSVLPGTIATDINAGFFTNPANGDHYRSRIPVGRLGKPVDVAGAVAFLASDEGAYVNGAEILVDGGALVAFA
jgi:L-rhamnose 1-dehydrogenase